MYRNNEANSYGKISNHHYESTTKVIVLWVGVPFLKDGTPVDKPNKKKKKFVSRNHRACTPIHCHYLRVYEVKR